MCVGGPRGRPAEDVRARAVNLTVGGVPEGAAAPPPWMQDQDMRDDYGWKQVHGDVFRRPPGSSLLAALVGTGWQLTLLIVIVLLFTIISDLYTEYGTSAGGSGRGRASPFPTNFAHLAAHGAPAMATLGADPAKTVHDSDRDHLLLCADGHGRRLFQRQPVFQKRRWAQAAR